MATKTGAKKTTKTGTKFIGFLATPKTRESIRLLQERLSANSATEVVRRAIALLEIATDEEDHEGFYVKRGRDYIKIHIL